MRSAIKNSFSSRLLLASLRGFNSTRCSGGSRASQSARSLETRDICRADDGASTLASVDLAGVAARQRFRKIGHSNMGDKCNRGRLLEIADVPTLWTKRPTKI